MIRTGAFLIVLIFGFSGPVALFVVAAVAYAFWFGGLELLVLCAAIDALFMSTQLAIPWFTLGAILALLVSLLVKPYLFVYN